MEVTPDQIERLVVAVAALAEPLGWFFGCAAFALAAWAATKIFDIVDRIL